jgi:hypothetical protein
VRRAHSTWRLKAPVRGFCLYGHGHTLALDSDDNAGARRASQATHTQRTDLWSTRGAIAPCSWHDETHALNKVPDLLSGRQAQPGHTRDADTFAAQADMRSRGERGMIGPLECVHCV